MTKVEIRRLTNFCNRKPCVLNKLRLSTYHRTPSGNPTKPSKWALLAQFVQSVLFFVHPKGAVANEFHFATAPFVLKTGIEPVRVLPHGILSPGRLPVPPHRRRSMVSCFAAPVKCFDGRGGSFSRQPAPGCRRVPGPDCALR